MKKQISTLLFLFVATFLFVTCNKTVQQDTGPDKATLDENGEIFMQCLQKSPGWQDTWLKITSTGTPLTNYALVNQIPAWDVCYVLPSSHPATLLKTSRSSL